MLYDDDFSTYLQRLEGILQNWHPGYHPYADGFRDFGSEILQRISSHREKVMLENVPEFPDKQLVGPIETRKQIQTWEELGDTWLVQGRYPEALVAFNRAMELDEKIVNPEKRAELQFKTSKIHAEFGRWEVTRLLLNECKTHFKVTENHCFLTQITIEKARIALKKGLYPAAQKMLEKALNTADHMHNFSLINCVCLQLGILFQIINSPKYVLAYFEEALRVAQKALNPRAIAEAYFHLGVFYQTRQDEAKTRKYYEISKCLCQQHDFLYPQGFIWLQEAVLAAGTQKVHPVLDFVKNALLIFIQTENRLGTAKCAQFLGKFLARGPDWETVQKLFELAIEIFQNFGIPYDLALCCVNYADQFLEREQIIDATRHYEMAANLFRDLHLADLHLKLEEELTILSRLSLDFCKAFPE